MRPDLLHGQQASSFDASAASKALAAGDGPALDTQGEPPWQPTMMDQASWLAAEASPLAAAASPTFE